jgi:hypothetical protein
VTGIEAYNTSCRKLPAILQLNVNEGRGLLRHERLASVRIRPRLGSRPPVAQQQLDRPQRNTRGGDEQRFGEFVKAPSLDFVRQDAQPCEIPVQAGRALFRLPINRLPGANQLQSELRDLVGTLDVRGGREDEGGSVLIPQERLP